MHFDRRCRTSLLAKVLHAVRLLIAIAALASFTGISASEAQAQSGWSSPSGPGGTYHSAREACYWQWLKFGHSAVDSRFIGAVPWSNDWTRADCKWTTWQYLCPQETGGGINSCGTILPSWVEFTCEPGYSKAIGNHCQRTPYFNPVRKLCSWNNGGRRDPSTPFPIQLENGSKALAALDFETADGLFTIGRHYRSLPAGYSVGARSLLRGLAAGWAFDFSYELQMGDFSGSPSSPNAKLTLVAPDGAAYDFVLTSSGTWVADTTTGVAWAATDLKLEYVGTLPSDLSTILAGTSTWKLTDGDDNVWVFHSFPRPNTSSYDVARPVSRTTRNGYVWTLAYNSDTSLASITDSFGREATFSWYMFYITSISPAPAGSLPYPEAIASINLPDGTSLNYTYDPAPATTAPSSSEIQHLIKVERLSGTSAVLDSHQYLYEDSHSPDAVTGIIDNRNVRTATYAYDDQGRAISSELANGSDKYTVEYTDSSTELTRRVTNPLGKVAVFTFTRFGSGAPDYRLTQVDGEASTNCPSSARSLTYGSDTFIATETDEEGRITSYTRDAKARPTTIIEAYGTASARTTSIAWHSTLNVPATIWRPGLTETRSYNSIGQLTSLTDYDTTTITVPYSTYGRTHIWAYDWTTTGLLNSVDGPLPGTGDTVSFTYSSDGYLATRTDEVGHTTTVTSRDGRGAPLVVEDENGVETDFAYDGVGRPLDVTINPGVAQSQYAMLYDATGNMTKLTVPGGGWTHYSYDGVNRVIGIDNDRGETQTITRNSAGEATANLTKDASSSLTRQQRSAYDELGRLMQSIGANRQVWQYQYDKVDNLTKTTDAQRQEWNNGWDALNRLVSQTDPDSANTAYAYAPDDNLTQLTDPRSLKTKRTVDGFGLTIFESNPDRGDRTYWYDEADRLTQMTDAKGQVAQYSYDNAGRQLTQTYTGASGQNIAFAYDSTASGNKGVGRLTSVTDASGSSAFVYDAQGRLVTDSKTIGSNSYPVSYAYDSNGLVTAITYPSGHVVTYTRASDGKITAVSAKPSSLGTSTNIATGISFAPFGPLTGLTYGNGLALARSYDLNYWLNGIALADGSTPVLGLAFSRDANGNLSVVNDTAGTGRDAIFGNDDPGRLRLNLGLWTGTGTPYTETSVIAANSNRQSALVADGGPLTSDPNYAAGTNFAYSYNARQRLSGLAKNGTGIASYEYDYAGLRVITSQLTGTPTTVNYVFAPDGRLLAEHDGATGTLIREYIWLDDMPLALVAGSVSSPTYYYVHTGQIGEPLIVTDASKAKVWDAAVDPWGKPTMLATPTQTINLRLPGQWYASESGLHQNWMRDYDPTTGRYIEADPLGINAGANLYPYVSSNPLKLTDRSGQIIPVALCAIGGLSGAAGEFVGSGFQFNWKHSVIAFGVGCVSGVAAPLVATTTVGSVALGALGNIVQSIATQYFDDCDVNWKKVFWSGLSGAFGGYLGGTFKRPDFIHDTQYPYINNAVNYDNAVKTARSGFIRNFAGSVVGSIF